MEVNHNNLDLYNKKFSEEQQQRNDHQENQNPNIEMDLSNLEPMINRLHLILIDLAGYEPNHELVKGLDQEAIKLLEYYTPVLSKENSMLIGYLGMWGLVLMTSKPKTSPNEHIVDLEEEKENQDDTKNNDN